MSSGLKRLPRCVGAALAAAAAFGVAPSPGAGNRAAVSILDSGFEPVVLTVKQWQVVTWTNDGKARHSVSSERGAALASGELDPGQAYANVFTHAGTFVYRDALHPSHPARVVVVAAPKPAVTGLTPPGGRKPKGFKPQPGTISASPAASSSSAATNWPAIGGGLGGTAAVLAATVLLARRLRARG